MAISLMTGPRQVPDFPDGPKTNKAHLLDRHSRALPASTQPNGATLEYDTKGGRKVKVLDVNREHKTVTIQDNFGNCQAFIWHPGKGVYEQKISNFNSRGWTFGGSYSKVEVDTDGAVIAYSIDGRVLIIAPDGLENFEP